MFRILENKTYFRAQSSPVILFSPDILSLEQYFAFRRLHEGVEVLNQRRLAAPGMADDTYELAFLNRKIDI